MRSLLPLGLTLLSAGWIQAQIQRLGSPDLGNLTASAILGWYAWHTAAKTIPSLVRNFREELAALRRDQQAEREAFRHELAAERQARRQDQQALTAALGQLVERLPEPAAPGSNPTFLCTKGPIE